MRSLKSIPGLAIIAFALMASISASQAATYFYHTDHLGTPQALTDKNQQVVWQSKQEPFGEVTATTNAVEQNLRFPGQYYDVETGLHYNYFRDYDSRLGRYVQSDPIGLNGGLNTYIYVLNNPPKYHDYFGLDITISFFPDAAGYAGHVGMGVNTTSTVGQRPSNSSLAVPLGLNVPGEVSSDGPAPMSLIIPTTQKQDIAAQQCIDQRVAQKQDYNLYTNNCSQMVAQCLNAAGIPMHDFLIPRGMWAHLLSRYGKNP